MKEKILTLVFCAGSLFGMVDANGDEVFGRDSGVLVKAFTMRGVGCEKAKQAVYEQCGNWVEEYSKTHAMWNPTCGTCFCGSEGATCVALARIDGAGISNTISTLLQASAGGKNCIDAEFEAKTLYYEKLSELAFKHSLYQYEAEPCYCGRDSRATCMGRVYWTKISLSEDLQ